MCLGRSSGPAPPPPPSETEARPPPAPSRTDPEVARTRQSARRLAARAAGRGSTILGGELTSAPSNQPTKTLLGQ